MPQPLQGALAAVLTRDVRGALTTPPQRLSHFPASPLVALSWFHGADAGLVEPVGDMGMWRPFGARTVVSGSQARPTVSWADGPGAGGMACMTVDVARRLLGLEPAQVHDRMLPARSVLPARWWPLLHALENAQDDAMALAALTQHLAPAWATLQGRHAQAPPSLQQVGRHWVQTLALQARAWQGDLGPRQVARRVRAASGRSLRDWQALVRTESTFFAARSRHAQGLAPHWADLAQEQGFADQAHLARAVRRITGFSPTEFQDRYLNDESFWVYRIWV